MRTYDDTRDSSGLAAERDEAVAKYDNLVALLDLGDLYGFLRQAVPAFVDTDDREHDYFVKMAERHAEEMRLAGRTTIRHHHH